MHNIMYYEYDENINRDYVQRHINYEVKQGTYAEGGHGIYRPIRWLESLGVCADREEAERVIEINDRKWYDQLAVRFYEPVHGSAGKGEETLKEKRGACMDAFMAKERIIWAQTVKAEFVGCKACGSRLRRQNIKVNRCPLCGADLRPQTMLKEVEAAKARLVKAEAALKEYIAKHSKKKVMWLVKIEFHT